ncbi:MULTISPECIES: hypothetical protein [Streptomyces]|uniref:Uncharacterized protein n=1 Tax=Streptomyces rubrogriseus TaxID=194673 RepID=A0A6G3T6C8_9ACTN|nr:hypothetical protein [Streptomyces rubrogriseus]NEC32289.1 hypothetical protein [Streptomyces rubrogriseus]
MMHCAASTLVKTAYRPRIRVMLGNNASQDGFDSTWTWTAVVGLVTLLATVYFSVDQVRKRKRAAEAKRLQPDYELLDEVVVEAGALEARAAQKFDLVELNKLCSRVKQAERRFPDLPFGKVVAHIDKYQKTVLPDGFAKKVAGKQVALGDVLDLSRQQGVALALIREACDRVQMEIDKRTQ